MDHSEHVHGAMETPNGCKQSMIVILLIKFSISYNIIYLLLQIRAFLKYATKLKCN